MYNVYDELIKKLRKESEYALPSQTRKALAEAICAIETMTSIIDGLNETIKIYANDTLSEPPKEES